MSFTTVPGTPEAIFTDGFLANPYPTYRYFLNKGPIHQVAIGPGMPAVFSYEAVSALLRDPRLSARRSGAMLLTIPQEQRDELKPLVSMLELWLLFLDPPQHTRLRKLLTKGFSPAAADAFRPRLEALADRMLDEIDAPEVREVMHLYAHPFPAKVIAHLLDIPEHLHPDLIRWSDAIAAMFGSPRRTLSECLAAQDAVLALTELFRGIVVERRLAPKDDLITLLLTIEADGDVLSEEEVYAQCVMLLFGGHETTRNLIGNGLFTLLTHPGQLEALREGPELIRSCVEELLRFQSPVQYVSRVAKNDLDLEGISVRAGDPVMLMLGAANRDPKHFADPDTFDLCRKPNAHLAFGAGSHFCIGNGIARLEAQVAILRLVKRYPGLQLTAQQPQWTQNYALRGFDQLHVQLK